MYRDLSLLEFVKEITTSSHRKTVLNFSMRGWYYGFNQRTLELELSGAPMFTLMELTIDQNQRGRTERWTT